ELQAAATDDGVVISLGEQHSFPLPAVFSMVRAETFEGDLVQAALASPMFTNRWRWNATRSLTLLRHQGGKKVPMPLQRMRAEDLLAAVFPEQLGCQDNRGGGPIEIPDHPLVNETMDNCLTEAMAEVARQAWPVARDADELHDVLLTLGLVPREEIERSGWTGFADALLRAQRATWTTGLAKPALVAAERVGLVRLALPQVCF